MTTRKEKMTRRKEKMTRRKEKMTTRRKTTPGEGGGFPELITGGRDAGGLCVPWAVVTPLEHPHCWQLTKVVGVMASVYMYCRTLLIPLDLRFAIFHRVAPVFS